MSIENSQLPTIQTSSPNKEVLPGNVVVIERPEARYRIVYGAHDKVQKASDIGNPDLVISEGTMDGWVKGPMASLEQNLEIESWLKDQKKPYYIVDATHDEAKISLVKILGGMETSAGLLLLASLARDFIKKKKPKPDDKLTRRQMLTRTAKGLGAGYLLSQTPLGVRAAMGSTSLTSVEKFLQDLNENIHPETNEIVFTFRNYLAAHKAVTLAKTLGSKGIQHPQISLVYGAGHSGLEKALTRTSEDRLAYLESILNKQGMEKIRREVSKIARVDFNERENRWEITSILSDPSLAPLESLK